MTYTNLRKCIANYGDKPFTRNTYAISNEFGIVTIVYADHEQDALDEAVDCGYLNSDIVTPETQAEFEELCVDDSICFAGNASKFLWCAHTYITKLNKTTR